MLNFQKIFEKSKYIHIGSCSVAKIPNNIVVQTESKTHLQFERKLKSKSQGKICHGTSLKPWPVFGSKIQNSKKKKIRHLHGDLNLDEIKNTLRLLSVNGETNLMNLNRL